ncbi:MAG: sigma-70 family RNA polymerase sigma factor [Clostridia bacterium]|nr:sigma-70 family RNA polymerase sigma factor [Clostridia bacterium]MBQ7121807.1 sigma-70 family RNA polymerase sigma factor [Clostridia bacterium]
MKETVELSLLIERAISGDEAASNELYQLTHKTAYHTASLLLKNPDDIQDVLQNSYLKVFQKLPELKNPESLEGWIKSIVENECKNYIKKEKRIALPVVFFKNKAEEYSEEWKQPVPQEYMEREELRKSISGILDRLSPEVRACIVLFHYEDKSLNEISEILSIPSGTVKSRLHNGRKQIEKEFNKLRKKDPTLYGIGAIPAVLSLISYQAHNTAVPAAISQSVVTSAAAGAGVSGASTATVGGAVTTAASTAAGSAATSAAASIAVKVAAVAVAGSVVAGGGAAIKKHIDNKAVSESSTAYSSVFIAEESGTTAAEALLSTDLSVTDTQSTSATDAKESQTAQVSTTNQPSVSTTEEKISSTAARTTAAHTTSKATTTAKQTTTQKPATTTAPSTAAATTNPENNYDSSGGVITEYSGSDPYVTVPSSVGGSTVTAVGAGAFAGNTDIRSVSLPSGVTQIGQEAFADCTSLSSVSLPSSLSLIGIGAFYNCPSLSSVSIPSGTQEISDEAFAQCTSLRTVTIPSSVTTISDNAFDGCDALTIRCEEGSAAHDFATAAGISVSLI